MQKELRKKQISIFLIIGIITLLVGCILMFYIIKLIEPKQSRENITLIYETEKRN